MVQIDWQEEARRARRLWVEAHKQVPGEVMQHAADVEQPSESRLASVSEQSGAHELLSYRYAHTCYGRLLQLLSGLHCYTGELTDTLFCHSQPLDQMLSAGLIAQAGPSASTAVSMAARPQLGRISIQPFGTPGQRTFVGSWGNQAFPNQVDSSWSNPIDFG